MAPAKFSRIEEGRQVAHDYGNKYFIQPCGNSSRLMIGPSRDQIDLLDELALELRGNPWFVLYVLLVPRLGNRQPGRYQSEPFETHAALSGFLASFRAFFESDARHHVWVGSPANDGVLVYDQHNVIFAYGPIDQFQAVLRSRAFEYGEFWFPSPHAHAYLPENDAEEERLMSEVDWKYFPLVDGDEWG